MQIFHDIRSALEYTVRELIAARHTFIINIRGPREVKRQLACTVQVIAESMIFDSDERGLTLDLPFTAEMRPQHKFPRFAALPEFDSFHYYEFDGIPCFAMCFGTDVDLAESVIKSVLRAVWRYPAGTAFECNVSDEGPD